MSSDEVRDLTDMVWNRWKELRASPRMSWMEVNHLASYLVKKLPSDYDRVDFREILDSKLTYAENLSILSKEIAKVSGQSAEVREELENPTEKVSELEADVARLEHRVERVKEEAKIEKTARQHFEEQLKKLNEEREAEKAKKPTIKIRVTKNFDEGILHFGVGQVVDTPDWDWAWRKVEQGYAIPFVEATGVGLSPELRAKLRSGFLTYLNAMGVTDAERYGDRFDEEVNQVQQYFLQKATSQEEAMELFSSHIDRIAEDIIRQETEKTRVQVPQRKGYVVPERARGLAVPTGLFKFGTQVAQPMTKEEVLAGPPMKRGGVTLRAEVLKADTHKVLREINLSLNEVKKLTWTPSDFKYQLGPYNWACASSLIDGTRVYRCVAEDTQGFMEKYIFIE